MPKFIAQHTPRNLDDFTQGYFEAMEWLLPEEVNRDKIRGFTNAAITNGKADCADFMLHHSDDLLKYVKNCDHGYNGAGIDFYLSRNGHGAGFFDRGNAPVFNRLQEAAGVYGGTNEYVYRGWIYHE